MVRKKTDAVAQQKPRYCRKKGLSQCYSCVEYITEEALCSAIRKIMSSHVNDRSVCIVQNECPLICKALLFRVVCIYGNPVEIETLVRTVWNRQHYLSPFSPIFFLFIPLWVSGSVPVSSRLPGPFPWPLETEGRVVISDFGRWSWLIDSTSDGTCVTSLFPGCFCLAICTDGQGH